MRLLLFALYVLRVSCSPGNSGGGSSGGSSSSGDDDAQYCDMCGADASYTETLDTSGTYAKRTLVSNGCPNHYNVCTGKGTGVCGDVGAEGTGTEALVQSVRRPVLELGPLAFLRCPVFEGP